MAGCSQIEARFLCHGDGVNPDGHTVYKRPVFLALILWLFYIFPLEFSFYLLSLQDPVQKTLGYALLFLLVDGWHEAMTVSDDFCVPMVPHTH